MQKLKLHITFLEPVLGSANNNPKIFDDYTASKAPTPEKRQEELKALTGEIGGELTPEEAEEIKEKQTTVFLRNPDGTLFCLDYHWRGFFKEALGVGCELGEKCMSRLSKWTIKRAVDSVLFVAERRIPFLTAEGQPITTCEMLSRPLRATTMRGERICLARSEVLPAGTTVHFTLQWLECSNHKSSYNITLPAIQWALKYGALKGFGQWRGGGYGRFDHTVEVIETQETPQTGETEAEGKSKRSRKDKQDESA